MSAAWAFTEDDAQLTMGGRTISPNCAQMAEKEKAMKCARLSHTPKSRAAFSLRCAVQVRNKRYMPTLSSRQILMRQSARLGIGNRCLFGGSGPFTNDSKIAIKK